MKELFAVISLILGFATFVPYYIAMWHGTVKPHVYSWIPWTLTTGVGFWVSMESGGGYGAWLFALQAICCGSVLVYAIFRGDHHVTTFDRMTFAGSILALILYILTKNAIAAVILIAAVDALGFVPTFRKSFMKPWDEPTLTYALSGISFMFAIAALTIYGFETVFYAAVLVVANLTFVAFALIRRSLLRNTAQIRNINM